MTFGEYIKNRRKMKGLSSRELARRAGISQAYLSQLETGKNNNPTAETIHKMAVALDIDYTKILSEIKYGQRAVAEVVNKKEDSSIENYSHNELINYDKYTFEIEMLLESATNITYKNKSLKPKEKKELLKFVDYLINKRNS